MEMHGIQCLYIAPDTSLKRHFLDQIKQLYSRVVNTSNNKTVTEATVHL